MRTTRDIFRDAQDKLWRGATVSCAQCATPVDARRAALGVVGEMDFSLCVSCNAPRLKHSTDRRECEPQLGTVEIERKNADTTPAGGIFYGRRGQ